MSTAYKWMAAETDEEEAKEIRDLAFELDIDRDIFKYIYKTTALQILALKGQIRECEQALFWWDVVSKNQLGKHSAVAFKEYKPVLTEVLNYWKTELERLELLPHRTDTKQQPKLKIKQIALKYFYEGLQITRENGNEIAKKYGHTSGEKLFQQFTFYSSTTNRKAKPDLCTAKKLKNKIELIESVIELLPLEKQARAKDEVSILNKLYEAEYQ